MLSGICHTAAPDSASWHASDADSTNESGQTRCNISPSQIWETAVSLPSLIVEALQTTGRISIPLNTLYYRYFSTETELLLHTTEDVRRIHASELRSFVVSLSFLTGYQLLASALHIQRTEPIAASEKAVLEAQQLLNCL